MPLDPLVKALLDKVAAFPRPKAWDVPPAVTRQSFAAVMQLNSPKDVAVGKIDNSPSRNGWQNTRPFLSVGGGGGTAVDPDLFS